MLCRRLPSGSFKARSRPRRGRRRRQWIKRVAPLYIALPDQDRK